MALYNIINKVMHYRLVTVHGPPGIGKTALACAVSIFLQERDLFDISFLQLPGLVKKGFSRLGGEGSAREALAAVARSLEKLPARSESSRTVLVVLDGCHTIIDAYGSPKQSPYLKNAQITRKQHHALIIALRLPKKPCNK